MEQIFQKDGKSPLRGFFIPKTLGDQAMPTVSNDLLFAIFF